MNTIFYIIGLLLIGVGSYLVDFETIKETIGGMLILVGTILTTDNSNKF